MTCDLLWKYCKNIVDFNIFFLIPPQISATIILFFFLPIFGNDIATIATIFFFFPYFGNGVATIDFFFEHGQLVWATGISVIILSKFKIFSLPLFLFLSHTFVKFR